MKSAILYSTKSGTSYTCAQILQKKMADPETVLIDLSGEIPDLSNFDMLIIGGGIRFGKFHKPLRKFFKEYADTIIEKPHCLFLCCGFLTNVDKYMKELFPKDILSSAMHVEYFGGELKPDKHRGFMKFLVRRIRNSITDREENNDLPDIVESNISLLATKILEWKRDVE